MNSAPITPNSLTMPDKRINNFWYVCNDSKTVVIFLHGIFSDSRNCWLFKAPNSTLQVFWPDLVRQDKRLGTPSIYLAGYYTAIDSGEFGIDQCANEVIQALKIKDTDGRSPALDRENLIFVCHSTGGIVARYMIERYEKEFRDKGIGLALMASPSLGSVWANVASLAAQYYNQKLGNQLRWRGDALEDIHGRFRDLVNQKEERMPFLFGMEACENQIIYREYIPKWIRRFLPNRLKVVTTLSAGQYFGAVTTIPGTDHFSIVKPDGVEHRSHEFLVTFMNEFQEMLRRKKNISSEPTPPISLKDDSIPHAPKYFQNRYKETEMVVEFLRDNSQRLLVVTGAAGMGKTMMLCRLLSAIEDEQDLDGIGRVDLDMDGIVYLNAKGNRQINAQNLLVDLCKHLPKDKVRGMETLFSMPQISTADKMQTLLMMFSRGCVIVLLDNFEDLLVVEDPKENFPIRDLELDEALHRLLDATQPTVKVILLSQFSPSSLCEYQPGKLAMIELEEGLSRLDTEMVLRKMDWSARFHLESAPKEFFDQVYKITNGHPRALELLHVIIRSDPNTTLESFLHNNNQELTLKISENLFKRAFESQDLGTQHIMMVLSIYGRPVPAAAVAYLVPPHLFMMNCERLLKRLVKLRLVLNDRGNYYLHTIERNYALSKIPRGELLDRQDSSHPKFTQIALFYRGANFLMQNRKSHEGWRTIEDITPQLAEFDLRCEGEDYETAAKLLFEIDTDFLTLWGYSPMVVEMYERLLGRLANPRVQAECQIDDATVKQRCLFGLGFAQYYLGRCESAAASLSASYEIARDLIDIKAQGRCLAYLGSCNFYLGHISEAMQNQQKALEFASKVDNSESERHRLLLLSNGRMGACFMFIADDHRAEECLKLALESAKSANQSRDNNFFMDALGLVHCYQGRYDEALIQLNQAKAIAQDIGDSYGLSMHACNHAEVLNIRGEPGDHEVAEKLAEKALRIGYGSLSPAISSWSNVELAYARLLQGKYSAAYEAASVACERDAPLNNPVAFSILGLTSLRAMNNQDEAKTAFAKSIELADLLLNHCAQNYYALEAAGLSLSGLVLCGDNHRKGEAIRSYQESRRLSKSPGRLRRSRQMFESLPDPENLLGDIRQVVVFGSD